MKLKKLLKNKLTGNELDVLPSSFDVVGDILVFSEFPPELFKKESVIGQVLLDHFNQINVVCKKTKRYSGKYRTPKLKIIAGQRRKEAEYKENNIRLRLNLENVYFSPRLSNERKRIYQLVKPSENILAMFSGCAVYPIVISKNTKAKKIYAIEINPVAHKYAEENLRLNKVSNVVLIRGDVRKTIPKIKQKFDRILMPLPKGAENFLDLTLKVLRKGTIIHFYTFSNEREIVSMKKKIIDYYKSKNKKIRISNIVKCGQYSPRTFRYCIDFKIL